MKEVVPLCRTAYEQETRKIILSLEDVTKITPNGNQILNKVSLGAVRDLLCVCAALRRSDVYGSVEDGWMDGRWVNSAMQVHT